MSKFKIMLFLFLASFIYKAAAQIDTVTTIYINDTFICTDNVSWGNGITTKIIFGPSAVVINEGFGIYFYVDTIVNNGSTFLNKGTVNFVWERPQVLMGDSVFQTKNLVINDTAGVTMYQGIHVTDSLTFKHGIVSVAGSAAAPDLDPEDGIAHEAIGASDASHIKGYIRQRGTGPYTYPVGDSTRYQPIGANLTTNSDGMLCRYQPGDAGDGPFLSTGLDATPLLHYNRLEYWDLSPEGSAEGTVSIYYDDNQNVGIGSDYATALKVAHKTATGWQNEGGTVSGSETAGSVTTTGSISSWSPFTLGSITDDSPLPVDLAGVAVSVKDCGIIMDWNTGIEKDLAYFEVQYSTNGGSFTSIGKVAPRGTGSHYNFTSDVAGQGRSFFRLCTYNTDGTFTYSKVMNAQLDCNGAGILVYPNPVLDRDGFFVRLDGYKSETKATLYDIAGRKVSSNMLRDGENFVKTASLPAGNYMLEVSGAGFQRQVFKVTVGR